MPAVVYGPAHEAESIQVSLADFSKVLREEGSSAVLEVTGLGAPFQVLIQEIDRDPVSNQPRHADLYAIKKGAKVTVSLPLEFVGESFAVKSGASIVKVLQELEIESDPSKLPQYIEVDISALAAIGDQLHVKDIVLPAGVTTSVDPEEVVVISQETQEETEEVTDAPDMSAIEVEKKGKSEEEGAE